MSALSVSFSPFIALNFLTALETYEPSAKPHDPRLACSSAGAVHVQTVSSFALERLLRCRLRRRRFSTALCKTAKAKPL
jgi:hypothetical protein